jgi:hypothetical protein
LESRLARVLAKTATAEDLKAAEDETGVQEIVVSEEAGALDETGQSEETEAGEREGENTEV